jgi:hypothetical protein
VRLAHSADEGGSIDTRASVEDPAAGSLFMLPNLTSAGAGRLILTNYAGVSSGDAAAAYRRSSSTDGGVSFAPSTVVRTPLLLDPSRTTTTWLGDYQGLWFASGKIYAAYVDNSTGDAHIAFYRAPTP